MTVRDKLSPMIQEKLARAHAEYGEKLGGRLDELTELIRRARAEEDGALARAQQLAHRLCGTAGSFGFKEVSDALAVVDRTLLALLEGAPASDEAWGEVAAATRRAAASVAK